MKSPFGVILAGGLSRRMGGGDKALLPLGGGGCLLDHVIRRFAPQVPDLALNANGDPARFGHFKLPVIPDSLPDFPGPLAGVLAGMLFARARGYSHIATVAADTPFLPCDLVPRLMLSALGDGAAHAVALAAAPDAGAEKGEGARLHPAFGLWHVDLAEDLHATLARGERKIVAFTARHGAATALFPATTPSAFFNVNTPEDLQQAGDALVCRS